MKLCLGESLMAIHLWLRVVLLIVQVAKREGITAERLPVVAVMSLCRVPLCDETRVRDTGIEDNNRGDRDVCLLNVVDRNLTFIVGVLEDSKLCNHTAV